MSQRSFIIHETPMRPRKTIVLQKIVFLNALPFNFAKKGYNQNRTNALYNPKNTKFQLLSYFQTVVRQLNICHRY